MNKNNTHKVELYESLTSMNSLAYTIISYGIFYGIKQAAFFFKLFAYLDPAVGIIDQMLAYVEITHYLTFEKKEHKKTTH
ncbi:hypothetical protein PL373_09335 [Tenacibaculum maritimum]|nr:hypothetical protein [Tenacibaculum maritimum]MDB0601347.1 hypothetical protein [Tenacibaculum maritimum]MDB0611768.1 hypothetical protein [Tenacibaculum maritimum]